MNEFENMSIPDPELNRDDNLRKTILNTRTSTRLGMALIILPGILLFTMILKEELGVNLGITNAIAELVGSIDQSPFTSWMSPVLFGIFPLLAVIILFLSMIHISYDKNSQQLHLVVKLRFWNIVLLVVSAGILGSITLYLIMENLGHLLQSG